MRSLRCLRCGTPMEFLMQEKFQKGDMGVWVGNLNFSMQGGFEMEVYTCRRCGKLEFYMPGIPEEEIEAPEIDEDVLPPDGDSAIVCVDHEGIPRSVALAAESSTILTIPNAPTAATENFLKKTGFVPVFSLLFCRNLV